MTEKPEHAKPDSQLFDLSWETEAETEETGQQAYQEDSGAEDVEAHGFSGFNLPE